MSDLNQSERKGKKLRKKGKSHNKKNKTSLSPFQQQQQNIFYNAQQTHENYEMPPSPPRMDQTEPQISKFFASFFKTGIPLSNNSELIFHKNVFQ